MLYTAALALFSMLFLWSALAGGRRFWDVAQGIFGVGLAAWVLYRLITGKHSITYPEYPADSWVFISVTEWGLVQYAAISIAVFISVAGVRAYLRCRG